MPPYPPYVVRKKKFIDKLKLHGKFDDYKKHRANLEKARRIRLKEALAKLSIAKRNQLIEENRVKNRKGVQKFRMLQKNKRIPIQTVEGAGRESNGNQQEKAAQSLSQNDAPPTAHQSTKIQPLPSSDPSTGNTPMPGVDSSTESEPTTTSIRNEQIQPSPPSASAATENQQLPGVVLSTENQQLPDADPFTESKLSTTSADASTENQQRPGAGPSTENFHRQPQLTAPSQKLQNEPPVSKSIDFPHSYKTESALNKAAAKTKKSLPMSPSRRKAVMAKLLRSFNADDQRDIIGNTKSKENKTNKGLSASLVKDIRLFYERDDISRISPNVKDSRKFVNPDTGKKEDKQIRHLVYKLSEVYQMFLDDIKENNESSRPPVKLSKFSSLRPEHVFLMSEAPRNVCFCLYHTNFIQCAQSLHKYTPELPNYGPELTELLVCDEPTKECYFKWCRKCCSSKIDDKIRSIVNRSPSKNKTVKWMQWIKDDTANRFQNVDKEGTQKTLVDYFLSIYPQFLKHSYVKRQQEKAFAADRKRVDSGDLKEALLQIDFAENFKCECQDEVQQAHYNQKQISLFTTALHHAKLTHSKVIASDNTQHSKETLVAYLYRILKELPSTIETVRIWSDGPSNQFKNKYIGAVIPLFENKLKIKIIWNFFATGHGKSCIDGIGAAVKSKVKGLVLARRVIVNNTKDFVDAFRLNKSKIILFEMTNTDIDKINVDLNLTKIFNEAPTIRDISKFHQMIFVNNKIKGCVTSGDE